MAAKITILRSVAQDHGRRQWSLLYWYPLTGANAVTDFTGAVVKVQNRSQLPDDCAAVLLEADKVALDNGEAAFERLTVVQTAGETDTAVSTRVLAEHASRYALVVAQYQKDFSASKRGLN